MRDQAPPPPDPPRVQAAFPSDAFDRKEFPSDAFDRTASPSDPFDRRSVPSAPMDSGKAMLVAQDTNSGIADNALRSFTITLPELVEPGGEHSMLAAGHWIAQLRPHICSGAGLWWDRVIQLVSSQYDAWLQANPLERVHIEAPDPHVVGQGQVRLEQRVTNLLMKAVPTTSKQSWCQHACCMCQALCSQSTKDTNLEASMNVPKHCWT